MNHRVRKFFSNNKQADALLLHNGDVSFGASPNFFYYSGALIDNSVFVAKRKQAPVLFVGKMNFEEAEQEVGGCEIVPYDYGELSGMIKKELKGCKRVAVAETELTMAFCKGVLRKATKAKAVNASKQMREQRMVKSPQEIKAIEKACKIARSAASKLEVWPGKSEKKIANELLLELYKRGSRPSFEPIVLSGVNTRFPHGKPSRRRLRKEFVFLVDWGAKSSLYCSDMTRCYHSKGRRAREFKLAYDSVKQICDEVADHARPGMTAKSLSSFADKLLKREGLPEMPHSLGHGIGLEVHEYPSFGKKSKHVLKKNSVFTIEPGFYGKEFGVRYENTYVLKNKAKRL